MNDEFKYIKKSSTKYINNVELHRIYICIYVFVSAQIRKKEDFILHKINAEQ